MAKAYFKKDGKSEWNGATLTYHKNTYGPDSIHGLPFFDFKNHSIEKFNFGGYELPYKILNVEPEKYPYPRFFQKKPNYAGMCHGCGHTAVADGLAEALFQLQIPPWMIAMSSGIGCSGKLTSQYLAKLPKNYVIENEEKLNELLEKEGATFSSTEYLEALLGIYRYHVTHGQATSHTFSLSAAGPDLVHIAAGGDGDMGAIGKAYFQQLVQTNANTLIIPMVNEVYGLTKGQIGPHTPKGHKPKKARHVAEVEPVDFVLEALSLKESTYIARVISSSVKEMADHYKAGILHKGAAVVDTISPCIAWNKDHNAGYFKNISINLNDFDLDEYLMRVKYDDMHTNLTGHREKFSEKKQDTSFTRDLEHRLLKASIEMKIGLDKEHLKEVFRDEIEEKYPTAMRIQTEEITEGKKVISDELVDFFIKDLGLVSWKDSINYKMKGHKIGVDNIVLLPQEEILAGILEKEGLTKYDPTNRILAYAVNYELSSEGYYPLGLIFYNPDSEPFNERINLPSDRPIRLEKAGLTDDEQKVLFDLSKNW